MIGLGSGAFWSLGPIFAETKSGSVETAALFMSVTVLGGALVQWPIGRLSDSLDRRYVLIGVSLAALFACAIIAMVPDLGGPWLALAFVFGAAFLPAYAVASAHIFDFADRSDYVEASAGMLLLYGLGSTLGPILASFGVQAVGAIALMMFIGAVQVAIICVVALRITRRASLEGAEKQSFDPVASAPVVTAGTISDG